MLIRTYAWKNKLKDITSLLVLFFSILPLHVGADQIGTKIGPVGDIYVCLQAIYTKGTPPPFGLVANKNCDPIDQTTDWSTHVSGKSATVTLNLDGQEYCLNTALASPGAMTGLVNVARCDGSENQKWTLDRRLSIVSNVAGRDYHVSIDLRGSLERGQIVAWSATNFSWDSNLRFSEPVLNGIVGKIQISGETIYAIKGFPADTVQIIQTTDRRGYQLIEKPIPSSTDISRFLRLPSGQYWGQLQADGTMFFWTGIDSGNRSGHTLNRNGTLSFDSGNQESPASIGKWTKENGVLIYSSRENADVSLYVEFEKDIDQSAYEAEIKTAIEMLANNYCLWSINVTTDRDKARKSEHWAWMFVLNNGRTNGKADLNKFNSPGDSGEITATAGSRAVLNPQSRDGSAYLLTHEFGHNFGLRGTTDDYSGPKPGAFMGGRSSRYDSYVWRELLNKKGDVQNPSEYFQRYARLLDSSSNGCR